MRSDWIYGLPDFDKWQEQDAQHPPDVLRLKYKLFNMGFHNLEAHFLGPKSEGRNYNWIPFPTIVFVDILIEAAGQFRFDTSKKFIDIGCGIGTKLLLANSLFKTFGIDVNLDLLMTARSLGLHVEEADALRYDHYGDFDFLYYFRPIRDVPIFQAFERKVIQDMKPGALLAPMHTATKLWEEPSLEPVGQYLFRKRQP